jgi:hypothetical protein
MKSFEQPSVPQEHSKETVREDLLRLIGEANALQANSAEVDIDDIDMRPEVINAQATLMTALFNAAENEPETFIAVADEMKDIETRRDLMRNAMVNLVATGHDMAFETGLEPFSDTLRALGWNDMQIEKETTILRAEALTSRFNKLLRQGDVAGAARISWESIGGIPPMDEPKLLKAVKSFVEDETDLSRQIENYRQLPNDFVGMSESDFTMGMYEKALAELPPGTSWEERKEHVEKRFAVVPDILARLSINRQIKGWDNDDRLRIFRAIRDGAGKAESLSYFRDYDFSPEGMKEAAPDLFRAYLKSKPSAILDRIETFKEPFLALPETERAAMIESWIQQSPEMLAFRLGETLKLDESQKANLVERMIFNGPYRLLIPEIQERLGMTPDDIVDVAFDKRISHKLLTDTFAEGVPRETLTRLLNGVLESSPEQFLAEGDKAKGVELDPADVQSGMEKLLSRRRFEEIIKLESMTGSRLDIDRLSDETLRTIKLTDISDLVDDHPAAANRLAMSGVIKRLEKIQGRSARAEHDAWTTELDPLLHAAQSEGLLSPSEKADAELFMDFVKEFGAVNTPFLLETFVGLKRAKTLEDIPPRVRVMLEESLGKKRVEKMKTPAFLLNEVRKFDRGMVSALLEDKVPAGITSMLGLELFAQKRGGSNWEQDDDPAELIGKWDTFSKASPERAAVPEGYAEHRFSVPVARPADPEKIKALVEVGEVRTRFSEVVQLLTLHAPTGEDTEDLGFASASATVGRDTLESERVRWSNEPGSAVLEEYYLRAANRLSTIGEGDEKKLEAMQVSLMEDLLKQQADEQDTANLMDMLMVNHALSSAPQGFKDTIKKFAEGYSAPDANSIRRMGALLRDYIDEHYLHPSQETHRVGHTPFSPELTARLRQGWDLQEPGKDPIVTARAGLDALNAVRTGGKTKEIALVPAQGLLRTYGGDLADACYTSRHNELAEGKYPDLHGMIFVTGRGTAHERMVGSTLFVEAERPPEDGGEKVLIVRANNPRENLINEVDSSALIRQTLDEAIATAKRRGLDLVVVPLDAASTSSSNRPTVAQYYQDQFAGNEKVALVRKAETNFNGYANWDRDGGNGVVVIWTRKEEEQKLAETPG